MHARSKMILLVSLSVACVWPAWAYGKTYTPAQLQMMVQAGNPPPQGSPTSQSSSMDFAACAAKVDQVVDAAGSNYPSRSVVNTASLKIVKLWTNDAAMVLTCSAADGKLVITTAAYQ